MFTVKLIRTTTEGMNEIRLVEAEKVDIFPAGKPAAINSPEGLPSPCTDKVRGIAVELKGNIQNFYVGLDPSQAMGDVDLYHCAYIENSNGSTTERVFGS